jgi:hypothetical protein
LLIFKTVEFGFQIRLFCRCEKFKDQHIPNRPTAKIKKVKK